MFTILNTLFLLNSLVLATIKKNVLCCQLFSVVNGFIYLAFTALITRVNHIKIIATFIESYFLNQPLLYA